MLTTFSFTGRMRRGYNASNERAGRQGFIVTAAWISRGCTGIPESCMPLPNTVVEHVSRLMTLGVAFTIECRRVVHDDLFVLSPTVFRLWRYLSVIESSRSGYGNLEKKGKKNTIRTRARTCPSRFAIAWPRSIYCAMGVSLLRWGSTRCLMVIIAHLLFYAMTPVLSKVGPTHPRARAGNCEYFLDARDLTRAIDLLL